MQMCCAKKTPYQYNLLGKYDVLECGDVQKLKKKLKHPNDNPKYVVPIESMFDIIKRAHTTTGHGGRDRMMKELAKKYANITEHSVAIFKSLFIERQRKRKRPTTQGVVVRPILSKDNFSRGQVDLIDIQSMPHGEYKVIMV